MRLLYQFGYYYGDRSTLANSQGKKQAALFYAKEARKLEDTRRRMLYFYNEKMLSGKWKGILKPGGISASKGSDDAGLHPALTDRKGAEALCDSLE